jgi:hypothetical protein
VRHNEGVRIGEQRVLTMRPYGTPSGGAEILSRSSESASRV